jgi:tRNA 2-thiouridine synthesizing protein A
MTKAQAGIVPVRSADLTGEVCPMTFVKVKLHLEQIEPGDVLEVLLKEGEHMKNVPRSVKGEGHRIVRVEPIEGGRYRLLIVRGGGRTSQEVTP